MKTDIKEIQKTALELFRNEEINEALDYLFNNLDDENSWRTQLYLLAARDNFLERSRISGIITKDDYKVGKNRVFSTFYEIVNLLEEPYSEGDVDSPEPYYFSSNYSSTYTSNESLLIVIIVLLILIVIGIIFIIFKLN